MPADHYHLPPLEREGADQLLRFVEEKKYFVVHAPRQSGKTTALIALRNALNERGYRAVYANLQGAQTGDDDVGRATRTILGRLATRAEAALGDRSFLREWKTAVDGCEPEDLLRTGLRHWAATDAKPLVVLLDEVDALEGATLLSVLHQLRADYDERPTRFPASVAVCGLRSPADYAIPSASPFNIVAESLRLGDFSEDEVRMLLGQHTGETGQRFTEEAILEICRSTKGQPWLVNAIAEDACFRDPAGRERSRDLTREAIRAARERLILRVPTHFRQIAHRLKEERVRLVLDPILAGLETPPAFTHDDARYVSEIGLIVTVPKIEIANPIYREVIPRLLAQEAEPRMFHDGSRFLRADGGLEVSALLREFQQFFRENAEWWARDFPYSESGAQVLLQAYLQRVVNAGGHIAREYGLGTGRTDLRIAWGDGDGPQIFVLECKVRRRRDGLASVIRRGAVQTAGCLDRSGAEEGHLLVFDRDEKKTWDEKLFRREVRVRRADPTAEEAAEEHRPGRAWEIVPDDARPSEGERTIRIWGL